MAAAQDKFEGLVLRYREGILLDKEKFDSLSDDEVRLWLGTEEVKKLSMEKKDNYVGKMVFSCVLAKKNLDLLKYTCEALKITKGETLAVKSAVANAAFPETLRYLNDTYWKDSIMASCVIEDMFIIGYDIETIKRTESILGPVGYYTREAILSGSVGESTAFGSDRLDAVMWAWPQVFPRGTPDRYEMQSHKNRTLFKAILFGDRRVADWILANGGFKPKKNQHIVNDFKRLKELAPSVPKWKFVDNMDRAAEIFGLS